MKGFISELKLGKNSTKLKRNTRIFYADFETVVYKNKHYVTCYSVKEDSATGCKTNLISDLNDFNLESKSDTLLKQFIDDCFNFCTNKSCTVFFHNMGRFDGIFLLHDYCKNTTDYRVDIIIRDQTIYSIKFIKKGLGKLNKNGTTKDITVTFRDTFLLLPESLSTIAKIFNKFKISKEDLKRKSPLLQRLYLENSEEKIDFNYNNTLADYSNPHFLQKLQFYCESDVRILSRGFTLYCDIILDNFKINPISCLTFSSLAFKIFRTYFYNTKLHGHIAQSHGALDSFIRSSYRGGVAEVYKPHIKNGYYYDVNSLYPFIMSNSEMPIGRGEYIQNICESSFNINTFFGFIEVEVECPEMYIPFLTVNDTDKGLISPIGTWKGVYFSEEIKYALTLGYKFKYKSAYSFKKAVIFDNYVNVLYAKRLQYKDSNPPLANIIKLLLNSLYGRFGMQNCLTKTAFLDKSDIKSFNRLNTLFTPYSCQVIYNKRLVCFDTIPNLMETASLYKEDSVDYGLYYQLTKTNDVEQQNLNISIQIASAITAYARIYMHKLKDKFKSSLYYSDTDSLVLDKPLDSTGISSSTLGCLKLECKISEGLFVSPKFYYILTDKAEEIKKAKGVNKDLLTYLNYKDLYEDKSVNVTLTKNFLINFSDYTIHSKDQEHQVNGYLYKRIKIYSKETHKWVDTKPLILTLYDTK